MALNGARSEEHTSELQSRQYLVCRLLLEKKKKSTGTAFDLAGAMTAYAKAMDEFQPSKALEAIWELVRFFFNDTATTEIYTLYLHDALPISALDHVLDRRRRRQEVAAPEQRRDARGDRKSTRLNSSHATISYADFCLKT